MEKAKPIKRHKAMQPLSREHHQGLLLSWKIRTGFSKGVSVERIKTYLNWFFSTHLMPHFEAEEEYIFPILGNEHELVKKAISQHRRLERLFNTSVDLKRTILLIEEELQAHIRFEERILFNEIQQIATTSQLDTIAKLHPDTKFTENTSDVFWK
ncbi:MULTISPECIES: hemerythrin domain-containing protein [Arenibacter]|uniref:hemerythrin domain-containing protein n=1 Tax=Arenibacter TaxID=178469 RepID=UPI000A3BD518|nr:MULTISPECIES: hemerythrin domain-containing protein [Arenibacter]